MPQPLIVVGVDGREDSDAALDWAVEEARLHGETVEAVSVLPISFISDGLAMPVDGVAPESVAEEVDVALARVGGSGDVPVDVRSAYGSPGVVLRREGSRPANLVVIGRASEQLGNEALAGSVTRAVRRSGSRPVVVVPSSWSADRRKGVISVGVDGTGRGRAALGWAMGEAEQRQAKVRAVLAWDGTSRARGAGALSVVADSVRLGQAKAEEILRAEIDATRQSLPELSDVDVIPIAARAAAHVALLRESAGADLLVVGDHRRLEIIELLLGSTTRVCLRHAATPVVLVPDVA